MIVMNNMTIEQLQARHSTRNFRPLPIPGSLVESLKAELTMINSHEAGLQFKLVTGNSEPLKGFSKSYGFFRNANNFIVAIVDVSFPDAIERAGYFAEQIVLKATDIGLATCFVGGTYSKTSIPVPLRAGQEVLFLILVGQEDIIEKPRPLARIAMKIAHRNDKKWEDFFVERKDWTLKAALERFPFLKKGLQALACAPSSLNKQPFRIWIGQKEEQDIVRIGIPDISDKQFIDLGIAKCNFVAANGGYFDWGNGAAYYQE